jgi:hypothetical protein
MHADVQLIGVRLVEREDSFVIEVWDTSPQPPRLVTPSAVSEHGRGLQLVNALSIRWGYCDTGMGSKVVWCELSREEAADTNTTETPVTYRQISETLEPHFWRKRMWTFGTRDQHQPIREGKHIYDRHLQPRLACVVNLDAETAAITLANLARRRCVCQEEEDAAPCDCTAPVTREQIGRLHAFLSLNARRAVIYSDSVSEWLAALHEFLPTSEDPLEAWLAEPFGLPAAADLQHSPDLGTLLDMLGAPPAAVMS